jgi:hypothetical protein
MKKSVIILGAGTGQTFLYNALRKDFALIGVDRNPAAPCFALCDEAIVAGTHEAPPIIRALETLRHKHIFDGVITNSVGRALVTQNAIAGHFSLPAMPASAVDICIRKSSTIAFAHARGIPAPQQYTMDELKNDASLFPVIVKPDISVMGKRGIFKADSLLCLQKILSEQAGTEIEQYIEGEDVSCSSYVTDGTVYPLATVNDYVGVSPAGDKIGLGYGLRAHVAEVLGNMQELARALHIRQGILSVGCRLQGKTPFLIEIHLDIGGDQILEHLLPAAGFINPVIYMIKPFLISDLPLPEFPSSIKQTAMLYILYSDNPDRRMIKMLYENVGELFSIKDNSKIRSHLVIVSMNNDFFDKIRKFDDICNRKNGMRVSEIIPA